MENPLIYPVRWGWRMIGSVMLALATLPGDAAELDVTVLDRFGQPVPDVAVYLHSEQPEEHPAPSAVASMEQARMQFLPPMLVVQTGTQVEFPNSDVIAHHVYSFSTPNNFVLPMFRGNLRPQVTFAEPGIVTVGCNLHDDMLGYILVVNSSVFGMTGLDGKTQLIADNPEGLTIAIWSPRLNLDDEDLTRTVSAGRSAQITFSLTQELRAALDSEIEAPPWIEE